jgi:hypothetical protein
MESREIIIDDIGQSAPQQGTPVFIKVLCILTFVGSGLSLLQSGYGMVTIGAMRASFKIINSVTASAGTSKFGSFLGFNDRDLENYLNWLQSSYYAMAAGCVLTILGAVMMLRLKRAGFYLYLLGELLPIVFAVLVIIASRKMSFMGMGSIIWSSVTILFSLAFVAMYAINFRHLRR